MLLAVLAALVASVVVVTEPGVGTGAEAQTNENDELGCDDVSALMDQAHHERNTAKNYPQAIELYQAAIACEPTALAYLSLGGAFTLDGRDDEAETAYRAALALDLNPVVEYRSLGELAGVLLRRGDYESAIDLATQSVSVKGGETYATAWSIRAQALEHLGRWDQALTDRSQIIEIYPASWHAHYSRGVVYAELGQSDMAAADFERAIELDGTRSEPRTKLAELPTISWTMPPRYDTSWDAFDPEGGLSDAFWSEWDSYWSTSLRDRPPRPDFFGGYGPPSYKEVQRRGVPKPRPPGEYDRDLILPDAFEVHLSACGETDWLTEARGSRFDWRISPKKAPSPPQPAPEFTGTGQLPSRDFEYYNPTPSSCNITTRLPEGDHRVTVQDLDSGESLTSTVTVHDWLIVSLGDSAASGEGNPPYVFDRCHRGKTNQHAMAAEMLEAQSEQSSVTFVSLACSGASVWTGLIEPYRGTEGAWPVLKPQYSQLAELLCGPIGNCIGRLHRPKVDLLLLSVGVNDLDFSGIMHDCAVGSCAGVETEQAVHRAAYLLRYGGGGKASYTGFQEALDSAEVDIAETVITQYPTDLFSSTEDGDSWQSSCVGAGAPFVSFRKEEAKFIAKSLAPILTHTVARGAAETGWTATADPTSLFWGHGMCEPKDNRWIIQIDAGDLAADKFTPFGGLKPGPAHPNRTGHRVLAQNLMDQIERLRADRWLVSFGGATRWTEINNANQRLADLRVGDFDGDGKDDLFTTAGNKWLVSYGGTTAWTEINTASEKLHELQFGDFNGDGKTDVFTNYRKWLISYGGTTRWTEVNAKPGTRQAFLGHDLVTGDFDGDGREDLVAEVGDELFPRRHVAYSSAADAPWTTPNDLDLKASILCLNTRFGNTCRTPSQKFLGSTGYLRMIDLQFGDFDGDGKTDALTVSDGNWWIWYNEAQWWQQVNRSTDRISHLRIGDFDGDGKDDIFTINDRKWLVSYGGTTRWAEINTSSERVSDLLVGDFDGDGKDDIFTISP